MSGAGFPYGILLNNYDWVEFRKYMIIRFHPGLQKDLKPWKNHFAGSRIMLIMYTNPDLRDLNSEIEKILLYIGDRKEITAD